MSVSRELQRFPSRNYPYRRPGAMLATAAEGAPPPANTLFRRVGGIDTQPRPMTEDELRELGDPFGQLLRSGAPFPLSLRELLSAIDGLSGPAALPDQLVFLVADGGHTPWSPETDALERAFRIAVARGKGEFPLLVSASTRVDGQDNAAFLQVIGWDSSNEVFHFYERREGTYFWAGMSKHALEPATRGQGPFDSHVNGALVMKELRAPWIHWHSPQAGINQEALAPDDPLRSEPVFLGRVTAERLETEVVRPGIRKWNEARVRKAVNTGGTWPNVRHFLRQLLSGTTVNLASSDSASHLLKPGSQLRPPLSFFLDRDILFDTSGLEPDDAVPIVIPGRHYLACLAKFDVHRSDGNLRVEGDSHFAFLTPEPAFEDTHLIDEMIRAGLLSRRLAMSLAMTDFRNPVFSPRRARLLRYVPESARGPNLADALDRAFVDAVRAAGAGPADPETEFLANWDEPDPDTVFRERIARYVAAVAEAASDGQAVEGWFRLMEYRRRLFRRRPLAEFGLTTPRTNIPESAPGLRMTETGIAEPMPEQGDES